MHESRDCLSVLAVWGSSVVYGAMQFGMVKGRHNCSTKSTLVDASHIHTHVCTI